MEPLKHQLPLVKATLLHGECKTRISYVSNLAQNKQNTIFDSYVLALIVNGKFE